jgi:hypothetical protein
VKGQTPACPPNIAIRKRAVSCKIIRENPVKAFPNPCVTLSWQFLARISWDLEGFAGISQRPPALGLDVYAFISSNNPRLKKRAAHVSCRLEVR